jgi:hypothetical protein
VELIVDKEGHGPEGHPRASGPGRPHRHLGWPCPQATALLEGHRDLVLRATSSWPAVVNFAAWIVGVAMLAFFLITK